MVSLDVFKKITNVVIDKLEGGYYHPDMLSDGRVKDTRYSSSGETMFGIDRRQGGDINTTSSGIKFWKIIDNANARKNWRWLYRGGSLEPELKNLASEMIYSEYVKNSNKYLSPQAIKLVNSDPRLIFNFSYATWNGIGWFKKFADKVNDAVSNGVTDTNKLTDIVIDARVKNSNSLISQQGQKISKFINDLVGFGITPSSVVNKKTMIPIMIIILGLGGMIYYLSATKKIKIG